MNAESSVEHGPFGLPLFDGPEARSLARVGVIDIGSNSVRFVVFDGAARSPAYYFNEKVLCGLGLGFSETGRLNPEGRRRALEALARFAVLAKALDVSPLLTVATAAVRDALDGPEFSEQVRQETGLEISIVDGAEEARLSAQGVLLGWPGAEGLVCDIGGSSMEIAALQGNGSFGICRSSGLGPLKLMRHANDPDALKRHISSGVAELLEGIERRPKRLFLVGGSWRAIARVDMERRDYPLKVLHEYRMKPGAIRQTIKHIATNDIDELREATGTSAERMRLVPLAALVLKELVKQLRPGEVAISSYGIREGLLYDQMSDTLRNRDPLIEAARQSEAISARKPGFGSALYRFIEPLYIKAGQKRRRLIKAACLLHDVSWRAHPDYRAEVCFDNATRANLGGLTHAERIFLGLALLHRYKSKRENTNFDVNLLELLPETDVLDAEILGRAIRFGACFSLATPSEHGQLKFRPKRKELCLSLISEQGRHLFGEVAEARFAALAAALGAEPVVTYNT